MAYTNTLRAIILLVIGCIAVYLAFRRRRAKFLPQFFALIGPYAYFGANLGVVLTPAKLIAIVALIRVFLDKQFWSYNSGSKTQYFVPYFIYIVILTVAMASFWPSFDGNTQGFLYGNSGRWATQIVQQALGISIVLFLVRYIKSWNDVDRILSVTLLSMLVMGIIGLYIYAAQRFGLPFPRIARADGLAAGHESIISTEILGLRVVRAYSLSGEPKGLASDMVLGLTLLIFVRLNNKFILVRRLHHLPIALMMFLTLFLTYSTAGYIMLPAAMCIGGLIIVLTRVEQSRIFYTILTSISLVLFFLLSDSGAHLFNAVLDRLVNRVGDSGLYTYAEDAIAAVWSKDPSSLFFGVGLGGSNFYIRELNPYAYFGKIAAPRGIYGFVGDKGLVGLVLYLFGYLMCLRVIWREMKANPAVFQIARGALIFCAVGLLLIFTKSGWYFEWFVMGLMIACANIVSRKRNRMRP